VDNPNKASSDLKIQRRGKEREKPKAKKPSKLKKIILKEREVKTGVDETQTSTVVPTVVTNNTSVNNPPATTTISSNTALQEKEEKHVEVVDGPEENVQSDYESDNVTSENEQLQQLIKERAQVVPLQSPIKVTNTTTVASISEKTEVASNPTITKKPFRDYCNQIISGTLNQIVVELLKELARFQLRSKAKEPIKAKMRRRFVCGFREVLRGLNSHKLKCVIIAPNIEEIKTPGGLDSIVHEIIQLCHQNEVQIVFALNKNKIARALGKPLRFSIVGIYNYDGANELYKQMLELAQTGRKEFQQKLVTQSNITEQDSQPINTNQATPKIKENSSPIEKNKIE